jgi:Flp pilus assembly protein TadD
VSAWLLLLLAARPSQETAAAREQARLCLSEQGDEGLAQCRLALEGGLKPERAAVVSAVLATKLAAAERWEDASAVLEAWCRLSPADPEPQRRLAGVLLFGLGRADEAVTHLQEAARLAPDDATTWGDLGIALASARRYDEAQQAFEAALRLDASFFELRPAARAVADAARQQRPWPLLPTP